MKRILTAILIAVFAFAAASPAFAAPGPDTVPEASAAESERKIPPHKKEMKEKYEKMQANFVRLSAADKNDIYVINDEITKLQITLLDKYATHGVLTLDEAVAAKKHLSEQNEKNKKDGVLPGSHKPKKAD